MTRPLSEQVVVITGASSGIGRRAAVDLGAQGAAVVLAARNEPALLEAASEVKQAGGRALAVVTDVGDWSQVEALARAAIDEFGRIDTWVNNAAVAEYATVEDITIEEINRLIQVDLLGQIYGVKAALPYMTRQGEGTIINVGSMEADRAIPYHSVYSAAKHGVKGFTEALRLELGRERSPIQVTLILPSAINTPFFEHSRSRMGTQPRGLSPIYEPDAVSEAIMFAAEHPRRDIYVGAGKSLSILQRLSPSLTDWWMQRGGVAFREQQNVQPDDRQDSLFAPMPGTGSATGSQGEGSHRTSLYTRYLEFYPNRKLLLYGGILSASAIAMWRLTSRQSRPRISANGIRRLDVDRLYRPLQSTLSRGAQAGSALAQRAPVVSLPFAQEARASKPNGRQVYGARWAALIRGLSRAERRG